MNSKGHSWMIIVLLSKNESNHRQKQSYDNVIEFQLFNLGGNGHLNVKVISEKFNMLVLCLFVQAWIKSVNNNKVMTIPANSRYFISNKGQGHIWTWRAFVTKTCLPKLCMVLITLLNFGSFTCDRFFFF